MARIVPEKKDNFFHDLIIENNVYFAPGGYMVRSSAFLDVNPNRHIYESPPGQNWQMLLPIAYKYKCGYLDEFLYDYIVRNNSLSRKEKSKEAFLIKLKHHEDILRTVISEIDMSIDERSHYLRIIDEKYARKKLRAAVCFEDMKLLNSQYVILKKNKWLNRGDRLTHFRGSHQIINFLYKKLVRLIKVVVIRLRVFFYNLNPIRIK